MGECWTLNKVSSIQFESEKSKWKSFNHIWLFAIPWTKQSMEFFSIGVSGCSLLQEIFPTQE